MAIPALVVSGEVIAAAWGNAVRGELVSIRSDMALWTSDVDGGGNTLSNVVISTIGITLTSGAAITAAGDVRLTKPLALDFGATELSSAAGSSQTVWAASKDVGSNLDYLQSYIRRTASGTSWTSAEWRIQRIVDGSLMGALAFEGQDVMCVAGGFERFRVHYTGNVIVANSGWNTGHFVLGPYHIWVDASQKLRMKNGAPVSDTDGIVVGAQS